MKKETMVNKEVLVAGLIGVVVGVLLVPAVMRMIPWEGPMMGGDFGFGGKQQWREDAKPDGQKMMGKIDSHFIEQMIPHHEDAITMSNIALKRAKHPEIKTLAGEIIKAQSEEVTQMKAWYKEWFGADVAAAATRVGGGMGMMQGGMMGSEMDVKSLETSKTFDKDFIEQMIPHHQMAVMMAQMLARSTDRPEMKQLAQNIITSQNKEIEQMRTWYAKWY